MGWDVTALFCFLSVLWLWTLVLYFVSHIAFWPGHWFYLILWCHFAPPRTAGPTSVCLAFSSNAHTSWVLKENQKHSPRSLAFQQHCLLFLLGWVAICYVDVGSSVLSSLPWLSNEEKRAKIPSFWDFFPNMAQITLPGQKSKRGNIRRHKTENLNLI